MRWWWRYSLEAAVDVDSELEVFTWRSGGFGEDTQSVDVMTWGEDDVTLVYDGVLHQEAVVHIRVVKQHSNGHGDNVTGYSYLLNIDGSLSIGFGVFGVVEVNLHIRRFVVLFYRW